SAKGASQAPWRLPALHSPFEGEGKTDRRARPPQRRRDAERWLPVITGPLRPASRKRAVGAARPGDPDRGARPRPKKRDGRDKPGHDRHSHYERIVLRLV